jgi:hypothetical protein
VTDDRVIDYLRTRSRVEPESELVARVMAAVDAAPAARSPFAAFAPAAAVVAVVAVVIALVLILGQGPSVGPSPTDSAEAAPSPATSVELRAAVESGLEVLRESPSVEGISTSSVLGELGGATWFAWRPNGDQIVISRTDRDVSETAWWLDPASGPPARGENVTQMIFMLVGDEYFLAEGGTWVVQPREEAPPTLSIATGMLDGDELIVEGMTSVPPGGDISVTRNPDGGATWTLTALYRDGTSTSRWEFGPDGGLASWSTELLDVTPMPEDTQFMTLGQMEFTPLSDAVPIDAPDPEAPPDPDALGLPADFPLEEAAPS